MPRKPIGPKQCPVCSEEFYLVKGRTKANSCSTCYTKYRSLYSLLSSAKSRAKKKNLEYDLDIVWALNQPTVCPHTGMPMTYTNNGKTYAERLPTTASIDRVDPTKGYIKNNCQIISWWFNAAKQRFSLSQVVQLCQQVVNTYTTHNAQDA